MTLKEFCEPLYIKVTFKNQGAFMNALFSAARSTYGNGTSNDYLGKIFRGEPLTPSVRESFNPFKSKELTAFFLKNISDAKLQTLFGFFGIPSTTEVDKEKFAVALTKQFQLLVAVNSADSVENIVVTEYPAMLNDPASSATLSNPLYAGDSVYVSRSTKAELDVKCYEKFTHVWGLENYSRTIDWTDRYLELVPDPTVKIECPQTVAIPLTKHGGKANITAELKARGFEGTFNPTYVMKDKNGNECFPNRTFAVTVKVDFSSEIMEVKNDN
jgi:hypothetical protein